MDDNSRTVATGDAGEVLVSGPNVMQGFSSLPEQNARAFAPDEEGVRWYRMGDIVRGVSEGQYAYLSRRDRMVKLRGYRIELGEIEAGLNRHPEIRETAVVAVPDEESGVRIVAFVSGRTGERLGIIALKSIAPRHLPPYMVPDAFSVLEALPRTSTDKIDYQALKKAVA